MPDETTSRGQATDRVPRDVLYINARVFTPMPSRQGSYPAGTAVAVRGDRILAVGDEETLRARAGSGVVTVDLAGSFMMPAFHDSHVHLTQRGFELGQVDLHTAPSLEEGLARVAARAAETPPGVWVLGAGFALQRWGVTSLDRTMLDRVSPLNPVLLRSQDHHSAWVNTRALEVAGVASSTQDPPDGEVVRDERGEPTGLLLERALHLVWDTLPLPAANEIDAALGRAGADLAARGVATVHHMAYEPASYWRRLASAASDPTFPVRVWACIDQENIEHAASLGLATGQGGGHFTVGGAKFFADGALGSRTAWMLEPYAGSGETGVAVHGPQVLAERFPLAIAAGLAPVTHAIGDAAARAVLDALEATESDWRSRRLRPRLEHAQHLAGDDLERLVRMGVVASMQPIHLTFDVPSIAALLPDRRDRAYRIASLLAAGGAVAFGSDTPVAPPDVFAGLRAACRRLGVDGSVLCPDQTISVEQALHAYTAGAAYAIGREGSSGRLAPGYDADLVVLSHDPFESLDDLSVRATVKAGVPTYDPEGMLASSYTHA